MLGIQVDCAWCDALMTGSPHTSMPIATHHFKPQPSLVGVFLCSGRTVCRGRRDAKERRLSGWHGNSMGVTQCAPLTTVLRDRAQGCATRSLSGWHGNSMGVTQCAPLTTVLRDRSQGCATRSLSGWQGVSMGAAQSAPLTTV